MRSKLTIHPDVAPYLATLLAVGLATGSRMLLQPAVGDKAPLFTYFLAVLAIAAAYGLVPGLLATLLGGLAGTYFFTRPSFNLLAASGELPLSTITFFITGTFSSIVCEGLRRSREKARRLERELFEAQQLQSIGRLAGGVAHDFNNMLTAVIGFSELALLKLKPDDPARRYVEQIRASGERGAKLTNQLLAYARKQIVETRSIDLNGLIRGMDELLKKLAGPNVIFKFNLQEGLWPVAADVGQIEQVVINLLVNARDAMPSGGTFTLATSNEEGSTVALVATDDGIGMSEEVVQNIFEPFFTTKAIGKGTGLGLSTVFGIVKQSAGNISVESEPGKGTRFEIRFPRAAGLEPHSIETCESLQSLPQGEATVLIVENEDNVRQLAVDTLSQKGYRTLEAVDADGALQMIKGHSGGIDLLVTAVVMSKKNGPELVHELLALRPNTKVLYMTGYAEVDYARLNPLMKPFTPADLVSRVKETLSAT